MTAVGVIGASFGNLGYVHKKWMAGWMHGGDEWLDVSKALAMSIKYGWLDG